MTAASLETGADDCSCMLETTVLQKQGNDTFSFRLNWRTGYRYMENVICFTIYIFSQTLMINETFFYIPKVFGNPKNSLLLLSISVFLL